MFGNCESLTEINFGNFDTSHVELMTGAFEGCSALTQLNISNFNTSKTQYMG